MEKPHLAPLKTDSPQLYMYLYCMRRRLELYSYPSSSTPLTLLKLTLINLILLWNGDMSLSIYIKSPASTDGTAQYSIPLGSSRFPEGDPYLLHTL